MGRGAAWCRLKLKALKSSYKLSCPKPLKGMTFDLLGWAFRLCLEDMVMRKIFAVMMMCVSLGWAALASAAVDMTDPYKMVIEVANTTFETIKNNPDKMKDVSFRKDLIRNDLLPYVDTRYAAYKVMGTNLKSISTADRDAFTEAFAEYIVTAYADALALYNDQNLVAPAYKAVSADATQVNVKFTIRAQGKADLELVFKLRKNSKTGEWKAFDMVAEGISLLTAKENELSPLIRERGIKKVTELIKQNNAAGKADVIK